MSTRMPASNAEIEERRIRVTIVTNIPAPYRLPVFALLARSPDIDLHVIYCSGREPDRKWNLETVDFPHTFLDERFISHGGRFIHINHDIWKVLNRLQSEVVITTGFNPTHLMAYVHARLNGAKHVAMTDGTFESEQVLTRLHRIIRRQVFAGSAAFVGASNGAFSLYQAYGITNELIYKSHLCADNSAFMQMPVAQHQYDFIFCGRFISLKNPLFALDVAQQVARKLCRRVSIVFVGSGELDEAMRTRAAEAAADVEAIFPGFARQEDLPRRYASARIFLFPTQWEPWGVVANEACASGLPVLITPIAGSAGELVRDGENGFVLPLDLRRWVDAAVCLLQDEALYARFSQRSRELVADYTYENAAQGICNAVLAAVSRRVGEAGKK